MALRLDETGFGEIKIWQDPQEFCYGVDAVLLADFASQGINRKKGDCRIMDLGTGTGIIPLILSHKTKASYIGGIEVQEHAYRLGLRNIIENSLSHRLYFFHQNVADFKEENLFGTFDVVTTNPPYTAGQCGIESSNAAKAIARHEINGSLDDFVRLAAALLRHRGDFYMVHRPARLVDICCCCRKYGLEPKELCFVGGKPMESPNIILIHCVKNGNCQLRVLDPVYVHEADGQYSQEILKMYEKGK